MNSTEIVTRLIERCEGGKRYMANGFSYKPSVSLDHAPDWYRDGRWFYPHQATPADVDRWTFAAEGSLLSAGIILVQFGDQFAWMTHQAVLENHCIEWYESRSLACLAALEALHGTEQLAADPGATGAKQ